MGAYAFSIFDLGVEEAEQAIANEAPTDFPGASAALFQSAAEKHGKERWGDKTPHYVRHIEWLAEAYPDAQFVHMIRDGRDVARSRVEAGFTASIRASAQHWKQEVTAGRRAGDELPKNRYQELFYENLVRDPVSVLQDLCTWIDLEFDERMANYHQDDDASIPDEHDHLHDKVHQPVDPSRAEAWKSSLAPTEIADVEDVAGELLLDLGYDLTGKRVPLWLQGLRTAHRSTVPYTRAAFEKLKELGVA